MKEKLVELLRQCVTQNITLDPDCWDAIIDVDYGKMADSLLESGVTIQKWIPVTERLPEPEQVVWVQCKTGGGFKYQCQAFRIPEKFLSDDSYFTWDYECCGEYDEEADDYYVIEGWYERIYNWDEFSSVWVADTVTHWMPLPEPPKEGE